MNSLLPQAFFTSSISFTYTCYQHFVNLCFHSFDSQWFSSSAHCAATSMQHFLWTLMFSVAHVGILSLSFSCQTPLSVVVCAWVLQQIQGKKSLFFLRAYWAGGCHRQHCFPLFPVSAFFPHPLWSVWNKAHRKEPIWPNASEDSSTLHDEWFTVGERV